MSHNKKLSKETICTDPFDQFNNWYMEHLSSGIDIPDSVSLGTASADGQVSVRTVLLKHFDRNGFIFFTNYRSRKGVQIASNNKTALLFYWPGSGRQVRIEGTANKISEEESVNYFTTRHRDSNLAAWASEQSQTIPDRKYLENRFEIYRRKFMNKDIPKPPHWGGFRIVPSWFEFWEEGPDRMHYRVAYSFKDKSWETAILAP
jgi:pyridoxamine 5'-phosphate oxidase